jgi:hypothetical protein
MTLMLNECDAQFLLQSVHSFPRPLYVNYNLYYCNVASTGE